MEVFKISLNSNLGEEILRKYGLSSSNGFILNNPNLNTSYSNNVDFNISLDDVLKLFELQGVVGEKDLIKKLICSSIDKKSFGLEGYSGFGKTFIMNKLVDILPGVYTLNQTSGLATFYDSNKINESIFLYVPELQKSLISKDSSIIELLKDLSEGKSSFRIKTNSSRTGVDEQRINSNLTVIYTLALENGFKPDVELSRRFMHFNTDNSSKHIEEILDFKAKERSKISSDDVLINSLKLKVKSHMKKSLSNNYNIIDPFSSIIYKQFPSIKESIRLLNDYSSLVDGYAKFNYKNHVSISLGNRSYLITNMDDHKQVLGFSDLNFEINDSFLDVARDVVKKEYSSVFNQWFSKQLDLF